jgi:hypothetical protein
VEVFGTRYVSTRGDIELPISADGNISIKMKNLKKKRSKNSEFRLINFETYAHIQRLRTMHIFRISFKISPYVVTYS